MSSRRDLFDFLASRGARKACPVCAHEDWDGWDQRIDAPADASTRPATTRSK